MIMCEMHFCNLFSTAYWWHKTAVKKKKKSPGEASSTPDSWQRAPVSAQSVALLLRCSRRSLNTRTTNFFVNGTIFLQFQRVKHFNHIDPWLKVIGYNDSTPFTSKGKTVIKCVLLNWRIFCIEVCWYTKYSSTVIHRIHPVRIWIWFNIDSVKDYFTNLACEYFPLILSVILKLELQR